MQVGEKFYIEDLQSSNGTYLNNEPIKTAELQDGDKIRLGSTTVLKFSYTDRIDESFQQQMYDAALRDPLTRAYNKKYFLDRLETELAYARRHHQAVSVVMFDVEGFYASLFRMFEHAVDAGFVRTEHAALAQRATTAAQALQLATAAAPDTPHKWIDLDRA